MKCQEIVIQDHDTTLRATKVSFRTVDANLTARPSEFKNEERHQAFKANTIASEVFAKSLLSLLDRERSPENILGRWWSLAMLSKNLEAENAGRRL